MSMNIFSSAPMPLTNATLLFVVGLDRRPLITCGVTEDGDHRLMLEVLDSGHGATMTLRGPIPALRAIVGELGDALDQAQPEGGEQS
jgi:hypothetical protein